MNANRRKAAAIESRRGFQALGLLFVMPVLLLILLAAVQFGRTMAIRTGVTHAAILAAREAAKGGQAADVARAVNCVLEVYGMAVVDQPGSGTKLAIQDGSGTVAEFGDPSMSIGPATAVRGDEILATVWIRSSAKRCDGRTLLGPVCDVLGLTSGTPLSASSLAKKELPCLRPTVDKTSIVLASRDATVPGK